MSAYPWRSVVRGAYHDLTGSYVESDFPETTLAVLDENGLDETEAVHQLVGSKQPCSLMDAMRAVDNQWRKMGAT